MTFRNEQEAFWSGEFGDAYIDRNQGSALLASNLHFFAGALRSVGPFRTMLEIGANIGMNLRAIELLYPGVEKVALEINRRACEELRQALPDVEVIEGSIVDRYPSSAFDLVISKGVLIHLNPDDLPETYRKMGSAARRFVLIGEYYSPNPMEIEYRGYADRLFKRDFAGEFLEVNPEFGLRDYGFAYRRDLARAQDDISWFLLERKWSSGD